MLNTLSPFALARSLTSNSGALAVTRKRNTWKALLDKNRIPVWCGGMLESGVGRAHNIAMATLAGFTLPGDVSASDRYWHEDIIDPTGDCDPERNPLRLRTNQASVLKLIARASIA
jgi:hypothetical protein